MENADTTNTPLLKFGYKPPTSAEFVRFRADCGWGQISEFTAETALRASVIDVTCRSNDELVGLARVVGDGVLYFYVQDVIVKPDWRGHAVGRRMMSLLLNGIIERAATGATIGLMAAVGKEAFYERFGFQIRPTERLGAGMTQFVID